ncbi:MAG: DUF3990 domain-containing protein [Clostridiales Family XIII bacterium]|jgi:hypothetical protein|nr:DUF3990 domain-containing protein [Clostridiales Family XIII bacterium]
MSSLILYHGSNQLFDTVDLSKSRDKRDFGRGFYTTTIREQAALQNPETLLWTESAEFIADEYERATRTK